MKSIVVNSNDAGQRLDKFLQKHFESLPKSLMFKQIRKKNIKVNKKRCEAQTVLNEGDVVDLYLPDDVLAEKKVHYDFALLFYENLILYKCGSIQHITDRILERNV